MHTAEIASAYLRGEKKEIQGWTMPWNKSAQPQVTEIVQHE